MKMTKERIFYSLAVDLEYDTPAARQHLIDRLSDMISVEMGGGGASGVYSAKAVPDSGVVTPERRTKPPDLASSENSAIIAKYQKDRL